MPKLNQQGAAHLLLPLILLIGLVASVYLVTSGNPLKLFSKAAPSRPIGPETSFSLVGPGGCSAGLLCIFQGFQPQEEFSVRLYVRSDVAAANLFTAKINFPNNLVEVKEIKTEGTFIRNWVENFYDNNNGEISLAGGIPSPGYQTQVGGESGLMATIVFRAKSLGQGPVSFKDTSAIYDNINSINILTVTRPYEVSIESAPSPRPISAPVTPSPTPLPSVSPTPLPGQKGDGNRDGKINLVDTSVLLSDWMKESNQSSNFRTGIDMNDDGVINTFDFSLHRQLLIQLGVIRGR